MIAPWPKSDQQHINNEAEENMQKIMNIVKTIRNIKADMNIPYAKEVKLFLSVGDDGLINLIKTNLYYIKSLIKTKSIVLEKYIAKPEFSAAGVLKGIEIFIPLKGIIDIEEEIKRLEKRLKKTINELSAASKKLNNRDFLKKAPEEIIQKEKNKANELQGIKERLENNLKNLR
jgi:valyl-tRNA synthetase